MNLVMTLGVPLAPGTAYGPVSQRGCFCLNSGFRAIFARSDFTKFDVQVVSVAVRMVALPLLAAALVRLTTP